MIRDSVDDFVRDAQTLIDRLENRGKGRKRRKPQLQDSIDHLDLIISFQTFCILRLKTKKQEEAAQERMRPLFDQLRQLSPKPKDP